MLSDRCLSCLSVCLSVTFVHCGQTVGWIKMKLGMHVGLGPGHIVSDGDPAPPPPNGGRSPQFLAHICRSQMAWWIKMPVGMEVGRSPGDFVLDGDPGLPSPKNGGRAPLSNFCPISIVVKRLQYHCMHQDATWYRGRPEPSGLCVRWEPSPPKFLAHVYYSYCDFVRTLHKAQSLLVYSSSSVIFYAFYF